MEINSITITITPDDLEYFGEALEDSIKQQVRMMDRPSFDLLCEGESRLLRQLVDCGYTMYLGAGKTLHDCHLCHDVNDFIDHLYREKDAEAA
jgi:hypothetical protein